MDPPPAAGQPAGGDVQDEVASVDGFTAALLLQSPAKRARPSEGGQTPASPASLFKQLSVAGSPAGKGPPAGHAALLAAASPSKLSGTKRAVRELPRPAPGGHTLAQLGEVLASHGYSATTRDWMLAPLRTLVKSVYGRVSEHAVHLQDLLPHLPHKLTEQWDRPDVAPATSLGYVTQTLKVLALPETTIMFGAPLDALVQHLSAARDRYAAANEGGTAGAHPSGSVFKAPSAARRVGRQATVAPGTQVLQQPAMHLQAPQQTLTTPAAAADAATRDILQPASVSTAAASGAKPNSNAAPAQAVPTLHDLAVFLQATGANVATVHRMLRPLKLLARQLHGSGLDVDHARLAVLLPQLPLLSGTFVQQQVQQLGGVLPDEGEPSADTCLAPGTMQDHLSHLLQLLAVPMVQAQFPSTEALEQVRGQLMADKGTLHALSKTGGLPQALAALAQAGNAGADSSGADDSQADSAAEALAAAALLDLAAAAPAHAEGADTLAQLAARVCDHHKMNASAVSALFLCFRQAAALLDAPDGDRADVEDTPAAALAPHLGSLCDVWLERMQAGTLRPSTAYGYASRLTNLLALPEVQALFSSASHLREVTTTVEGNKELFKAMAAAACAGDDGA